MSRPIALTEKSLPPDCYVYKHSTTCPVSSRALLEVRACSCALPVYQVDVREQRELSNWVAESLGVTHESPQLILVRGGKARMAWSHGEIRKEVMTE